MKIKLKTEAWENIVRLRELIERLSFMGGCMFIINTISFWGNWWMFTFNLILTIIFFIVFASNLQWQKEQKESIKKDDNN